MMPQATAPASAIIRLLFDLYDHSYRVLGGDHHLLRDIAEVIAHVVIEICRAIASMIDFWGSDYLRYAILPQSRNICWAIAVFYGLNFFGIAIVFVVIA
jgi:hypothetical protein